MDSLLKIKKDYIAKVLEIGDEEIIGKIFKLCEKFENGKNNEDTKLIDDSFSKIGKPIWIVDYEHLPKYVDYTGGVESLKYTITC